MTGCDNAASLCAELEGFWVDLLKAPSALVRLKTVDASLVRESHYTGEVETLRAEVARLSLIAQMMKTRRADRTFLDTYERKLCRSLCLLATGSVLADSFQQLEHLTHFANPPAKLCSIYADYKSSFSLSRFFTLKEAAYTKSTPLRDIDPQLFDTMQDHMNQEHCGLMDALRRYTTIQADTAEQLEREEQLRIQNQVVVKKRRRVFAAWRCN